MAERTSEQRIVIGYLAGHCFHGKGDIQVARHCRRGQEFGYYHVRQRLMPDGSWEIDRWFEWIKNGGS